MIGESEAFLVTDRLISKMAVYDAPVLISGETGTGKELAARAIHYRGVRCDGPFVPLNCGAIQDSLVESELFGHRRGAFTDARDDQPGLIACASGGTLFLDEVDSLSPKAQVTLLRFLQDQQYRPLGSRRDERANVRVVAASNQPLDELVVTKRFRLDLLYRLRLMQLHLPPLRERKGDPQILAQHFIQVGAARFGCDPRPISGRTLAWMENYDWPGNVRELEHRVYQALLLGDGPLLALEESEAPEVVPAGEPPRTYRRAKEHAIAAFERSYLIKLIGEAQGNVSVAAKLARTDRRHLGRLLKKHHISNVSR